MKGTILYISKSGKSASISVRQSLGDIEQSITGFVGLPEGHTKEVGDEVNIPATRVVVDIRMSEEGEPFNFLRFE